MRSLKKAITLCLILLITGITYSQSNALNSLSEKYNAQLKQKQKGIGLLIKKNNTTETIALGDYNLTSEKVFSIGSATKTFTAVLVLQEMERGNLKLSDSIGAYLSPIENVEGSLTIESLLSHESGLDEVVEANILDVFFKKDDALYNQDFLKQIEPHKPEKVGTFQYCNTNYMLLGEILEKINDKHYFDLLRERIFIPLGLDNTHSYLHKNIKDLAIPTHRGKDVSNYIDHRFYGDIPNAAGSIASTLTDMEIFYSSLYETEKLLKKETLQLMLSSGNDLYGLGIFKLSHKDKTYYGHGGNTIGYAFSNAYDPDSKSMYLIFANAVSMPTKSIENDLMGYLNNEPIKDFEDVDIDSFKNYEGKYLLKEANLILKIVIEDKKIFLVGEAQGVKSELSQKDENTLIDLETGVSLTKNNNDSESLTFSQQGFTTVIKRIKE
ncbi:serine hydrolase domain-containing protein [Winogradskyella sp.]|uniref:serine hydrolase domain-containing protein n=1 Tax=Winogradskyella sp. TaxID=1883156 RepID=UPI0026217303|nr:serine hydrolase domain-containing protein [Winogradskyella sp.]